MDGSTFEGSDGALDESRLVQGIGVDVDLQLRVGGKKLERTSQLSRSCLDFREDRSESTRSSSFPRFGESVGSDGENSPEHRTCLLSPSTDRCC